MIKYYREIDSFLIFYSITVPLDGLNFNDFASDPTDEVRAVPYFQKSLDTITYPHSWVSVFDFHDWIKISAGFGNQKIIEITPQDRTSRLPVVRFLIFTGSIGENRMQLSISDE